MDLIAAEAGITKKTLCDRFGSKDQIVVEYLADRDERWRAYVTERLEDAGPGSTERVLAVFDASKSWMDESSPKGCSTVNAHAEISDPAHPAYAIIAGQKERMLQLFTGPDSRTRPLPHAPARGSPGRSQPAHLPRPDRSRPRIGGWIARHPAGGPVRA